MVHPSSPVAEADESTTREENVMQSQATWWAFGGTSSEDVRDLCPYFLSFGSKNYSEGPNPTVSHDNLLVSEDDRNHRTKKKLYTEG